MRKSGIFPDKARIKPIQSPVSRCYAIGKEFNPDLEQVTSVLDDLYKVADLSDFELSDDSESELSPSGNNNFKPDKIADKKLSIPIYQERKNEETGEIEYRPAHTYAFEPTVHFRQTDGSAFYVDGKLPQEQFHKNISKLRSNSGMVFDRH